MNRKEAAELLPIIKAFSEGKVIQVKQTSGEWISLSHISFDSDTKNYRTKPEPKYRPFKDAEECWAEMQKHEPFGWVKAIPNKEYKAKYYPNSKDDINLYYQVQKVAPGYIKYDDIDDYCEIGEQDKSYEDVFKVITFADGTQFGILEDE